MCICVSNYMFGRVPGHKHLYNCNWVWFQLKVNLRDMDLIGDATESVNIADCGETSPCDRNPCLNNGECVNVSKTEYFCRCRAEYTGKRQTFFDTENYIRNFEGK